MAGVALRVVLVRPQDARNVGSVCRAMKTMGIESLSLVERTPIDLEQAAVTAVHAEELLETALHPSDLPGAVADAVLVAGVTRRRGKWRKYVSLTPEQLAERIATVRGGTVALVFGNEMSGLSDEELSACHVAVRIPSSPAFPSLNLSHAVQIVAYALFRRLSVAHDRLFRPIPQRRLQALVEEILGALQRIGFFTQGSREEMGVFLRDILARAALSSREAARLAVVFRKIAGLFRRVS